MPSSVMVEEVKKNPTILSPVIITSSVGQSSIIPESPYGEFSATSIHISIIYLTSEQIDDPQVGMAQSNQKEPSIVAKGLTYRFQNGAPGLNNVNLDLPSGSRTLLIGGKHSILTLANPYSTQAHKTDTPATANGAGKTTLLRLLAGKRLAPTDTIAVGGTDPFKDGLEGVTYLGVEWVLNQIVRTDMDVPTLLASVGGNAYPDRRDELVDILDIDLRWRMHAVSDGERRRVQLAMGLLRPWQVLLLDEITVDLDLLSRSNFLSYLKRETESRACTIVYATHILDNLSQWPTHLVHMNLGAVRQWGPIEQFQGEVPETAENSQLGELVLKWLKEDLKTRGPRNGVSSDNKTYESLEGIGGYGFEKRS